MRGGSQRQRANAPSSSTQIVLKAPFPFFNIQLLATTWVPFPRTRYRSYSPGMTGEALDRTDALRIPRRVRRAAIEDVVADLGGLVHGLGPVRRDRYGVIVECTAGGVLERNLAGE